MAGVAGIMKTDGSAPDRAELDRLIAALAHRGKLVAPNAKDGRLVLTRDPFGIEPLYYIETKSYFAFASEPKALIEAGLAEPDLVRQVRNELLQLQFTADETTIYTGIKRVLPGETLVVKEGRIVERYHRAALPIGPPRLSGINAALVELERLLTASVAVHRDAGLFLSGSIDSLVLASVARRVAGRPVTAFNVRFGGVESERVQDAAKSLDLDLVERQFREGDFWRLLPKIAAVADDPVADYALLPTYRLAAMAEEAGVATILCGEGADELFGGYGRYRTVIRPWWAGGKAMRRRGVLDGLGILRGELTAWRDRLSTAELVAATEGRTKLQIAQAVDCTEFLPNNPLIRIDRCLSARRIDGQLPFLEAALADFAFSLPDDLKIRDGVGKWLLRRWLHDHTVGLDPLRRRKRDSVPVADWIRRRGAMLGPLVARQPGITEICLPSAVEMLFAGGKTKQQGLAAWVLLFYALWHRAHILRLDSDTDVFQALSTTC